MYNWNTDLSKMDKKSESFTIWKLNQLINFGLNGEKLDLKLTKKYWSKLSLDPQRKKFLALIIWPYMTGMILNPLQKRIIGILTSNKSFTDNFYLTGGTALSEFYLHHRVSEDLDFFCENEPDKIWLASIAKGIKSKTKAEKVDIQESFNRNLVYFTYPDIIVKTEFTYFPFTQIERPNKIQSLNVDSLIDIAVNKFFAIYQKPTARHFIDLYLIIKTKNYIFEELEKMARIKFDTVIDPIQLGSQLIKSEDVADLPKMIIKLQEKRWRSYFMEIAKSLKNRL